MGVPEIAYQAALQSAAEKIIPITQSHSPKPQGRAWRGGSTSGRGLNLRSLEGSIAKLLAMPEARKLLGPRQLNVYSKVSLVLFAAVRLAMKMFGRENEGLGLQASATVFMDVMSQPGMSNTSNCEVNARNLLDFAHVWDAAMQEAYNHHTKTEKRTKPAWDAAQALLTWSTDDIHCRLELVENYDGSLKIKWQYVLDEEVSCIRTRDELSVYLIVDFRNDTNIPILQQAISLAFKRPPELSGNTFHTTSLKVRYVAFNLIKQTCYEGLPTIGYPQQNIHFYSIGDGHVFKSTIPNVIQAVERIKSERNGAFGYLGACIVLQDIGDTDTNREQLGIPKDVETSVRHVSVRTCNIIKDYR